MSSLRSDVRHLGVECLFPSSDISYGSPPSVKVRLVGTWVTKMDGNMEGGPVPTKI